MKHPRHYLVLAGIIAFGAFLRYFNPNWDSGYMLHPDERFLTMVVTAMTIPSSFAEYINPAVSKMNPANIDYLFFVYGAFPLILNKFMVVWNDANVYPAAGIFGRSLSATFDVMTMILVYKITKLLQDHFKIGGHFSLLATFFYAVAVLPIQLSHFFASEPFLTFFLTATLLFCLYVALQKRMLFVFAAGATFGLALACKVSALYMLPLYIGLLYVGMLEGEKKRAYTFKGFTEDLKTKYVTSQTIVKTVLYLAGFAIVAYSFLRVGNPYYFETADFLNPQISKLFAANIKQLESFNSKEGYFPPAIQWMNKPSVIYSVFNFAVLGVGIPYFILICIGMFYAIKKHNSLVMFGLVVWPLIYFFYNSLGFVKVLRYTVFLYPVFAIFAALAVVYLLERRPKWSFAVVLGICLIWPFMFMNIYFQPNSRVEASYWIHANLPDGSFILSDHWDDPLPLLIPGGTKYFPGEQLEVFVPDSPEKFAKIQDQLNRGNYYIMSSNRAWGSIPTVPEKYPRMVQWYEDLFAEKLGYRTIREITVYPSLEWLGIPLSMPDDWADETFTVYDHPKVIIMENTAK